MKTIIYPLSRVDKRTIGKNLEIFLAGSIEMGLAGDWQTEVWNQIPNESSVIVYNPRRTDWDSSWVQSISNPQFYGQVNWELDHIEKSQIVFFYFDPNTKSPISMMELGYVVANPNFYLDVVVCCPVGFWRKGNIDIMCERSSITVYEDIDTAIETLLSLIEKSS